MTASPHSDRVLVERVRSGETEAWQELIERYEGRLLAYVSRRLASPDLAEDLVQETLIGFLTSLPNYDLDRSLEGYLLSIAAHKLTDHLRREGRRPAIPFAVSSDGEEWEPPGSARPASSLYRSRERIEQEEKVLQASLSEHLQRLRTREDWEKLKVIELLVVRGWANKYVAETLGVSEQKVANLKHEFLTKLRTAVAQGGAARIEPTDADSPNASPASPGTKDDSSSGSASGSSDPLERLRLDALSDEDLEGYLDEALPAEQMAVIEQRLRTEPALIKRIAEANARRDNGAHTLGAVWRRGRFTCASRLELGNHLLGVLAPEHSDYIEFHLQVVGCRGCQANLEDLKQKRREAAPAQRRRKKYFESSAGFLPPR
ncbi:MAG TPA: sigma-70 family RNA polymerase sigma factor [Pirellulales bacterium]